MKHYGDPCLHCGTPHDDVQVGECPGNSARAIPIAWASLGVRYDGVEHFRIRMSDGRVVDRHNHISERAPYFHFGHSPQLATPLPHDLTLRNP
jgi:hypothetical protein